MLEGIRLGRVAGFPVAVNWSVLVILWLFTWSLASYSLPGAAPGHSLATYWLAGFVGALLLLGSLLAHELAHALTARRAGLAVTGLTLWLFGGVASLRGEAKTPGADFRIAVVGPATSLVLAAAFAGIATTLDVFGLAGLPVSVVWWLAGTNLLLGLFNLLPGAPLDGGRILRAYLWRRHGDRVRAALGATRAGQVVAFVLIGLGLLEFLAGGGLSGLWLVFLGWFLLSAARMEETEVTTRQRLVGVRVGDVMSLDPRAAPSWLTVEEFIQRYVWGDRHSAYPVTGPDGTVEGLVTLAQLRGVAARTPHPHSSTGRDDSADGGAHRNPGRAAVSGDGAPDATDRRPRPRPRRRPSCRYGHLRRHRQSDRGQRAVHAPSHRSRSINRCGPTRCYSVCPDQHRHRPRAPRSGGLPAAPTRAPRDDSHLLAARPHERGRAELR